MKKHSLLALLLLVMSSCTFFLDKIEENSSYDVLNIDQENLSLIFSHNINGETHPCGCRHFPLGGLPQVAGLLAKIKKTNGILYVDSGDMLFPASTLPKSIEKSLKFAATNLAKAQEKMGLKYFVPGDQDFAAGLDFLKELANEVKFKFLISNLRSPDTIKHKEWAKVEKGPHKIYLLGIVAPSTIPGMNSKYFTSIKTAFEKVMPKITADGYDQKNPFHRLVVVSHSGMEADLNYAKIFPHIDWIIGSHTQNFTRYPKRAGETRVVQVLSRNHYVGEIRIALSHDKKSDDYHQHEIGEALEKELNPNPFTEFIIEHKNKLTSLQEEEQNLLASSTGSSKAPPYMTANSCMECHEDQSDHWQKSAHSLAYITLLNANEAKNTQCIKCHSLGLNDERGFFRAVDMARFDEEEIKKENLAKHQKDYWDQVKNAFAGIKSVRDLKPSEMEKYSKQWLEIDTKMKVSHNFSNVQCLNCHTKHPEHPFDMNSNKLSKKEIYQNMKKKCLECHDPDQSPEWYKKDEKGLARDLDESILKTHMKKIGCPKNKEEE